MIVCLAGLPGIGKTTLGRLLAQRLNWHFHDTDRMIEMAYRDQTGQFLTCSSLFQKLGKSAFRSLESETILSFSSSQDSVLSLGGGSLEHPQTLSYLKSLGLIIYLKASLDTVWNRLSNRGNFPSFLDQTDPLRDLKAVKTNREQLFEQTADMIFSSDGLTPEESLVNIYQVLQTLLYKDKILSQAFKVDSFSASIE